MNTQKIGELEVHELANMVPLATAEEQASIVNSIKLGGQQVPIVLYRDMIIDGRCRALACEELGIEVKFESLPYKLPISEVAKRVLELNTRRNLTPTQKAIIAFRAWSDSKKKVKQKEVILQWGVSKPQLNAVKYLTTHKKEYVDTLFSGYKVNLGINPDTGKPIKSHSLQTVVVAVRKEVEAAKCNLESHGANTTDDPEKGIPTILGKEKYKETIIRFGGFVADVFEAKDVKKFVADVFSMDAVITQGGK